MSKTIAGISKRHFQRLVKAEKLKMEGSVKLWSKEEDTPPQQDNLRRTIDEVARGLDIEAPAATNINMPEMTPIEGNVRNGNFQTFTVFKSEQDIENLEPFALIQQLKEENTNLREKCTKLEKDNQILKNQLRQPVNFSSIPVATLNNNYAYASLAVQATSMDDVAQKLFSKENDENDENDVKIFPLRSLSDLENLDNRFKDFSEEDLIAHLKELVGSAEVHKSIQILLTDEVLLQVNWDGKKNKIALNKNKIFNAYLYEATKREGFEFIDFENAMRKGIRLAKNKFYSRKSHWLKQSDNAA